MNILFPFFRALALSGLNLNRSDSRCIFFVYDARMRSAVSSLGESIGLLLRVIDDRDPMPLRTCAAKQTAAAPTAQRTVLFRGRPNELHGWIKTASCHVLRWQNLTWSTKNIWRGEGHGDKMPQTVERTAGRQLVQKYSTEGFFKDSPLALRNSKSGFGMGSKFEE